MTASPVQRGDGDRTGGEHGQLVVGQGDRARWRGPSRAGMSEASRATPSCQSEDQRGGAAGRHDGVGLVRMHHRNGEGAAHGAQGVPGRLGEREPGRHVPLDQVGDHLGVGGRGHGVARARSARSRSTAWFSMIPLWMMASRPVQSRWGWAFSGVGCPWVAQRVWPIPARQRAGRPVRRQLGQIGHRLRAVGRPDPPDAARRPPGPPRPSRTPGTRAGAAHPG